jgi:hypothetical protein
VVAGAEVAKKAVQTGDIAPDDAIQAALLANPASVAYRTGMGVAKAALTPLEAAQRETGVMAIPRAALKGAETADAKTAAAAQKASEQLQAAVPASGTTADVAGGHVRAALEAAGDKVPPRLSILGRRSQSNEDTLNLLVDMAKSKHDVDVSAVAALRRFVPKEQQEAVQGAIVERLGRDAVGFSPGTWVRNYGEMTPRAKNVLFGSDNPLRTHLDAIETVSRAAPTWERLEAGGARGPLMKGAIAGGAGLLLGGPVVAPLAALGAYIPAKILSNGLAKPATAAPIAQWSKAYERVVRSGGGPQSIAAFTIATRNLNNTLGVEVDADKVLRGGNEE